MNIINIIKSIDDLVHLKGCSKEAIIKAENTLGLMFSDAYKAYISNFGAISFYGTEWTGLGEGITGYINVVEATQTERKIDEKFPKDCFLIENLLIDKALVISDSSGIIYFYHSLQKEKIYDSLEEYLLFCIKRTI